MPQPRLDRATSWRNFLIIIALLVAGAGAQSRAASATEGAAKLGFGTDPAAALRQAAAEHKPVLAFFTTDWCSWCRRLEADVLSTPEFQAGSNGWVKLVLDAEKGQGVDWAKRHHVSGYPTLILLDEKGEEIDRQSGYAPMPGYLRTFQDFERGVGTLAALRAELAGRPGDHALAMSVAGKLSDRGQTDEARALLAAIVAADSANTSGVADEAAGELALLEFRQTRDPKVLEAALVRWKGLEQASAIYNQLIGAASKAGDEPRMRDLLERAVADCPTDVEMLNSYGWTCAEKGWNLEKALELTTRAVELSGGEANVLDTQAELFFRLGRKEEALAAIRRALAARPDDPYLKGQEKRFQGQ